MSLPELSSEQPPLSDEVIKDATLDSLSHRANVAQFISFSPDLRQRFARIRGHKPNHRFKSMAEGLKALLSASPERSVNVRSFAPGNAKSREFVYGLQSVEEVVANVKRLASEGHYTIANETIDVHDGGVSGVALGGVVEFAPDDTPRCVEKPGTVAMPRETGIQLLTLVYGFEPRLDYAETERVEFSIHPIRRGFRDEHTIVWELEEVGIHDTSASVQWPNAFSKLVGDKTFGLLIAHMLRLPVPFTTVVSRRVAPFTFGTPTGTGEYWIRTCPVVQMPGLFTTKRGWTDPFRLMHDEDPAGTSIAAVLSQEGVNAKYSGALITGSDSKPMIEGVKGLGDVFMVGETTTSYLPDHVVRAVRGLYNQATSQLGPVRFEWVFDGEKAWIVQLHRGATESSGRVIYPGQPKVFRQFHVREGIDRLRQLIAEVKGTEDGITVIGNVGITSHIGDLLRKAKIPSKLEYTY